LAAELRWILLGLSLPLLAGIWWWTARRSRQTPGNAELRESIVVKPAKPAAAAPTLDPRYADSDDEADSGHGDAEFGRPPSESRDWGVPPFEPLNIRTAEFDQVPVLDGPMMVHADPMPAIQPDTAPPPPSPAPAPAPSAGASIAAPPSANAADLQRIVTIRVCAVGEMRWSGAQLMAALETHGLAFGRYQVFHRKHTDGRSLFCVASLIEPGTFDVAEMADQEFRGITLFAVLPGPVEPLETMNELFGTARGLAEELSGMVQDGKGMPMSPQRAAALREDIARFQAQLPGN
jgi:cell division protein ZipA